MAVRRAWTTAEVQALQKGVGRHGVGNWAEILKDEQFHPKLKGRTNVNLKDK